MLNNLSLRNCVKFFPLRCLGNIFTLKLLRAEHWWSFSYNFFVVIEFVCPPLATEPTLMKTYIFPFVWLIDILKKFRELLNVC